MKVKRLLTTLLCFAMLLTVFVMGAYAVDENAVVDWAPVKSQFSNDGQLLTGDSLFEIGDNERNEDENNDTMNYANYITHDLTYYGMLPDNDVDYFKVNLAQTSTIMFFAASDRDGLKMELLDNKGNVLMSTNYSDYDELYYDGIGVTCGVGTYYVRLTDSYSYYYYNPLNYLLYFSIEEMHDYGYGQCGDNAYWSCDLDGNLIISGYGDQYDFRTSPHTSGTRPWSTHADKIKSIVIEDGITNIPGHSFYDCTNLTSVSIPESVKVICSGAFHITPALEELIIPGDNVIIEGSALSFSARIITVTGDNVVFEDGASHTSDTLEILNIAGQNTVIGDRGFHWCPALKTINVTGSISSIGNDCFIGRALTELHLPSGIESIGESAFSGNYSLLNIQIDGDVGSIGANAFSECTAVEEVVIFGNVDTIAAGAFQNCSAIETVFFGGDAPVIDATAFTGVTATVYYPADNATYTEDMMLDYGGDLTWVAHTHNYEETVVTEAFDTTDGEILYHCPDCGHEYTVIVPAPNPFDDVILGKFYYNPVMWALENNITKGITDSTFEPDTGCSRGQVVTFLWRAAGCPEPTSTEHNFTDVRKGAYYYKAMLWAVEQGITVGTTKTTFAPDDTCTRGQVVTFLWRAAGSPTAENREHSFTDVRENGYYFKAMLWAVENGITKGTTKTEFAPDDTCNRGQVVTFLYRQYA